MSHKKNKNRTITLFLFLSTLFNVTSQAQAQRWNVDYQKSSITFTLSVAGQNVEGQAKSFTADILFPPDKIENADISVDIDMNSITVGNSDGDAALKEKEWLNTSAFPQGKFTANKAARKDDGTFNLTGSLELRGTPHPITLPFTLGVDGKTAIASGTTSLLRTDFDIGTNAQTGPITVGEEVKITIHLTATRQ